MGFAFSLYRTGEHRRSGGKREDGMGRTLFHRMVRKTAAGECGCAWCVIAYLRMLGACLPACLHHRGKRYKKIQTTFKSFVLCSYGT